MKTLILVLAFLALVVFGVVSVRGGGFALDAGGVWRDAAQVGLQKEQVKQAGETERARIAEQGRAAALPWAVGAVGIVGLTVVGVAWSRRTHRPAPAQVLLLAAPHLAADPARYLAEVEGEWVVVDDDQQLLIPLDRRLTG